MYTTIACEFQLTGTSHFLSITEIGHHGRTAQIHAGLQKQGYEGYVFQKVCMQFSFSACNFFQDYSFIHENLFRVCKIQCFHM